MAAPLSRNVLISHNRSEMYNLLGLFGAILCNMGFLIRWNNMKIVRLLSKYPFSVPGFVTGLSSTLDLGATVARYHNYLGGAGPGHSDFMAMKSDWIITGNDLSSAIVGFGKEADTGG